MVQKRIWLTILLASFCSMLGLGVISPMLPIFTETLGADGMWLAIIFASYSVSRGIFMPLAGKLSDIIGKKFFIVTGLILYAIVSFLYIPMTSLYWLTFVRILHGISSGILMPVLMAYGGSYAKKGKEGTMLGVLNMMFFLGAAAGPLLSGVLIGSYGIAPVFYLLAGVCAITLLFVLLYLPSAKTIKEEPSLETKEVTMSIREVFKYNVVKAILLMTVVISLREALILSFLPSLAEGSNISISETGMIIAAGVGMTGVLQIPFGQLADRVSRPGRLYQIIAGSLIGSIALLLMPVYPKFWFLLIASVLVGIGAAISIPATMAISTVVGRKTGMGSWMGVFNSAMSAGMIIAPLAAGFIMDALGINAVFYLFGIASFVGTFICYYHMWRRITGHKIG